jgi:predicted kinase
MLIIFSGLPAVGKTAIARELARYLDAVYLRIDTIEQALRDSGAVKEAIYDAGYRVAYQVAEDNLGLGRMVIGDSVNPVSDTRDAWVQGANRAQVGAIEIEIQCSDLKEHRRRLETRASEISGLRPLTWDEVVNREYSSWDREHVVIDSAIQSVEQSVSMILNILRKP